MAKKKVAKKTTAKKTAAKKTTTKKPLKKSQLKGVGGGEGFTFGGSPTLMPTGGKWRF